MGKELEAIPATAPHPPSPPPTHTLSSNPANLKRAVGKEQERTPSTSSILFSSSPALLSFNPTVLNNAVVLLFFSYGPGGEGGSGGGGGVGVIATIILLPIVHLQYNPIYPNISTM